MPKPIFHIKRAYDPPGAEDGQRFLVDRLWPRGITKAKVRIDRWLKELAPSTELRQWFAHDPVRWAEFQRRHHRELADQKTAIAKLHQLARAGSVTLVYAAKGQEHNNAVSLRNYLTPTT